MFYLIGIKFIRVYAEAILEPQSLNAMIAIMSPVKGMLLFCRTTLMKVYT